MTSLTRTAANDVDVYDEKAAFNLATRQENDVTANRNGHIGHIERCLYNDITFQQFFFYFLIIIEKEDI